MFNVLIVEDDPMVAMINEQYIKRNKNFKVIGKCKDGKSALDFLCQNQVDLLVLDVYMPHTNGFELLREIRSRQMTVEAIMVTAANGRESLEEALHLGIVDYLVKPFTFDRFQMALEKFIAQNNALKDIESGKIHKCFIEMSACVGSCIGGPVMEKYHRSSAVKDFIAVSHYAGIKDFEVSQPRIVDLKKNFSYIEQRSHMPTDIEIQNVLRQMGKFKPSQELNCGSCGYNTCREKAIAILQGKAEISMCLPFLKDKAESFSDAIVKNTPNGLIVLNEQMEVQQINDAALKMMNIRSASDIVGDQVVRILDPIVFIKVLQDKKDVHEERVYLAEYRRYVEQTVVYDKDSRLLICIMRDITDDQDEREKKEKITRQTIEVADKVVDKQMRIVQEIASLLGETAAETKIALAKLKESIQDE